ncbi:MAG TPA: VOC family protein [Micropepsaceae bacterium]|jgi:catechol 2,3-dioxygenase-like lactoylglutathione lyase family enzyme|nr:VOC family protein [Micropepsaceae bacterium]
MRQLPISGFDHLSLTCRRPAATLRFYTKVLGFRVGTKMPQWGMTELYAGGASLVLVNTTIKKGAWALSPRGAGENVHHFCLRLSRFDDDALRLRLKSARVAIEEEHDEGAERAVYIRDPEGNLVELRGKV